MEQEAVAAAEEAAAELADPKIHKKWFNLDKNDKA
jgi:hypothetical protein